MRFRLRTTSELDVYRDKVTEQICDIPTVKRFRFGRFVPVWQSVDRMEIGFRWRRLNRLGRLGRRWYPSVAAPPREG